MALDLSVIQPTLLELSSAWKSIPQQWVLIGFCLFCSSTAQDLRGNFIVHFLTTFMYGFGGGAMTSIMLMNPAKAPLSFLASTNLGVTWITCWWLMNYFPFRMFGRIHDLWPIKMMTKACIGYNKAKILASRVNLACEMFPGTSIGPILIGMVAICGGKISHDTIRVAQGNTSVRHELFSPTYSMRAALLCSAAYFFLVKFPLTAFLVPEAAQAAITTLLVGQILASELTGMPMDWTQPIVTGILTLVNIPVPGSPRAREMAVRKISLASDAKKSRELMQPSQLVAPSEASQTEQQRQQQLMDSDAKRCVDEQQGTDVGSGRFQSHLQGGEAARVAVAVSSASGKVQQAVLLQAVKAAKKVPADPGWTKVAHTKKKEPEAKKVK